MHGPGNDILSINGYATGTSMATPHVAAAVAFLKGINKNYTSQEIIEILASYSIDLGEPGRDQYYGYGLIDLRNFNFEQYPYLDVNEKNKEVASIEMISIPNNAFNYGNWNNFMNIRFKIINANNSVEQKYFWQMFEEDPELKVENYNATSLEKQTITVIYKGKSVDFEFKNGDENPWDITRKDNGKIVINKIYAKLDNVPNILIIPSTIKGKEVEQIATGAFSALGYVDTIYLPETVTRLPKMLFYKGSVRKVVSKAEKLTLEERVFHSAVLLEEIDANIYLLPSSSYVFFGCESLKTICLAEDMTVIPSKAFYQCTSLEKVILPDNLEGIQSEAFYGTALSEIYIPKNVNNIFNNAFKDTPNLNTIIVSEENNTYDSRENSNCIINSANSELMITCNNSFIPNTIKKIGRNAFYNKDIYNKIIVPNGVEEIGSYAFESIDNLYELHLPETITNMDSTAIKDINNGIIYLHGNYNENELAKIINSGKNYKCVKPKSVDVISSEEYPENAQIDDLKLTINYKGKIENTDGLPQNQDFKLQENIDSGYNIVYQNGHDCVKKGDNKCTVVYTNEYNETIEKEIPLKVTEDNNFIEPNKVELNFKSLKLDINTNKTFQLNATIYPDNTNIKNTLRWKSSDENIVTVDQNGLVSAISKGNAEIIVETENGISETCSVEVTDIILPVSINLIDSEKLIDLYEYDKNNKILLKYEILPVNANFQTKVTWNSSNPEVASIDESGYITINKIGTSIISVSTDNGKTDNCEITVIESVAPQYIELSKNEINLNINSQYQLKANIFPENAIKEINIKWNSSNSEIATVDDNGLIRTIGTGEVVITATTENGKSASCKVNVIESETLIEPESVTLDQTYVTIDLNEKNQIKLTEKILPENTNSNNNITWESSEPEIASVDQNGNIIALKDGETIITAVTGNGKKSTCKVKIIKTEINREDNNDLDFTEIKEEQQSQAEDSTTATSVLPNTGSDKKVIIFIAIVMIINSIILLKRLKRMKDIK